MRPPEHELIARCPAVKPKLLVVELWGLGDLIIATPFLQAAGQRYEVTLVAKPYAVDLQRRFWPDVRVVPFVAPWTAFKHKYRLYAWPWWEMLRLAECAGGGAVSTSACRRAWDPRDHLLLLLAGAKTRLGFPRLGSGISLAKPLAGRSRRRTVTRTGASWRRPWASRCRRARRSRCRTCIPTVKSWSTPARANPVRVWPLERYRGLVARLRQKHYRVQVACDPDQREWWLAAGEKNVATPRTVAELFALADRAGAFIGNDSGPGHLAAFCGVPTFTLFGPQMPEWFAPLHPASEWLEGKACPYKPCSDYCRFPVPCCMANSGEEEVCALVESFVARTLPAGKRG